MPFTSTCLCGAVKVHIKSETMPVAAAFCHCKNCQKVAGSVFSHNLLVPTEELEITGDLGVYEDHATDSGATVRRSFCKTCGNPITSESPNFASNTVLKLGMFDECPAPAFECYTKSKKPFVQPTPGAAQFETTPGA